MIIARLLKKRTKKHDLRDLVDNFQLVDVSENELNRR